MYLCVFSHSDLIFISRVVAGVVPRSTTQLCLQFMCTPIRNTVFVVRPALSRSQLCKLLCERSFVVECSVNRGRIAAYRYVKSLFLSFFSSLSLSLFDSAVFVNFVYFFLFTPSHHRARVRRHPHACRRDPLNLLWRSW